VHGAVVGRYGQVATVLPGDADGFARLYPDTAMELEGGREILAPVAALTAGLQALEAVRLLLGQPPAYHGRLAHFDGDTGVLELAQAAFGVKNPINPRRWEGTAPGARRPEGENPAAA
jgi:molybdopterin/thiamine biosynthesis adenylyltransferase